MHRPSNTFRPVRYRQCNADSQSRLWDRFSSLDKILLPFSLCCTTDSRQWACHRRLTVGTKRSRVSVRISVGLSHATAQPELSSCWDGRPFRNGPQVTDAGFPACVRKLRTVFGGCVALSIGELGPHLTQCGLGRGLPSYQVASWSIQPFDHTTPTLQDRQRSNSIGRTVLQTVVQKRRCVSELRLLWNTNSNCNPTYRGRTDWSAWPYRLVRNWPVWRKYHWGRQYIENEAR